MQILEVLWGSLMFTDSELICSCASSGSFVSANSLGTHQLPSNPRKEARWVPQPPGVLEFILDESLVGV